MEYFLERRSGKYTLWLSMLRFFAAHKTLILRGLFWSESVDFS